METNKNQLQEVATILRKWKGSDAADAASPSALAKEIDQVYAQYLSPLPVKTLAIRCGQEASERRAASDDSAECLEVEMFDQPTKFAPRPHDRPHLPLSPGGQIPAVIPVRGAKFSAKEDDDVPRLANVLVGLLVIAAVCAMALLALRVNAL